MPRPGSILRAAAGAAAALLASGCEYWRNLTEEIVPDQGVVTIAVRDALTGAPLPDASCGKRGQPAFLVDGNGVITRDDMPTGKYVLVCEAPFYRPREQSYELRRGQTRSDTIWLVRKGGVDWYQGEDRQVEIQLLKGNSRYPGPLVIKALPGDDSGRFWYEWSSNLNEVPSISQDSICTLYTPASALDTQTLNLGLKVWFKPNNDPQKYLIDSAFLPMKLVRNKAPEISLNTNSIPRTPVGCSDEPDSIRVVITAGDADGDIGCQVRVTNTGPVGPAGIIDTLLPCDMQVFAFKVTPHAGAENTTISRYSYLRFEATDQNGETRSTNLVVETISNIRPRIEMRLGPRTPHVFTTTQVLCTLVVDDGDKGVLDRVVVDWGNGIEESRSLRFERDLPHMTVFKGKFDLDGDYVIRASVNDFCKGSAEVAEPIIVKKNSMPEFTVLAPRGVDTGTGRFKLNVGVGDKDLDHGMDSVKLMVQWNAEGDPDDREVYDVNSGMSSGKILTHYYDPSRPEAQFTIFLQAFDQHDNRKDTTITIPRSEAIWIRPRMYPPY